MTTRTAPISRKLLLLLIVTLFATAMLPAQAAPVTDSSPTAALKAFEASLKGSGAQQRKAALDVLTHYKDYKNLVATGKVDKAVARALDEQLVQMTQETWRKVFIKHGSGLEHVVPVGTLGDRWNNPAYLPGKSDKDFIPRGRTASQAVDDFNRTFNDMFNIKPAALDVNVLDPTDPSAWPGRVSAASNVEKYNTAGGNKWLATEEALSKPNLWAFDSTSGKMREVWYEAAVKTPPPPLTKADALGWFSDNTRFRSQLADAGLDSRQLALKQAKYDLRNVNAYRLAGGSLSEADQALLRATELLRNGKTDAAIGVMIQATGQSDPQKALAAYLRSMNDLNESMARAVVASHLEAMTKSLANSRLTLQLENELAASMANLPRSQRIAAVEALAERFGRAKSDEIVKLADVFQRRALAGLTSFDDAARRSFGKAYDQLTDAERAVLHGADDVAESFMGKALRYTGYAFSGYAIYEAYRQGSKHGTDIGVYSAMARAVIEAAQAGVPILAIVEVVGQLTAGAVQLGAAAYKNAVLEALYQRYLKEPNLGFLLDIQGVVPYYAGGLRQLAIDLKMANPNISEAEIRKQLGDYFARRMQAEKAAGETVARMRGLLSWLDKSDIELVSTNDIAKLSPEDAQALAALLEAYERIKAQLERDGVPATEANILGALWHLYHRAGTPESYEKYLSDLYQTFKKHYPPVGQARQCNARPVIKNARDTRIEPAKPTQQTGTLLSLSGSFQEYIDRACDPAPAPVSAEISAGGRISVTVTGSGVPCQWSLWNSGGSVNLDYEPMVGGVYGPPQRIANAGLSCGDHPLATRAAVEADAPGPGRLTLSLGAPGGSGPLTGGCFAGSVSGQAALVEVYASAPAKPGGVLASGDRVVTGDNGTAQLIVPGFVSVAIRNRSAVAYTDRTTPSAKTGAAACSSDPVLKLEQGGMRLHTLPGGQPMPVEAGGRTVTPQGTDIQVEVTPEGGQVIVFQGAAVVRNTTGRTITVPEGKMVTWPGDTVEDVPANTAAISQDVPYADLPLDDTTPANYGEWAADFSQDGLPEGWAWSDPDGDASWTSPRPGTIQVSVPHNNDLWNYVATAPVLVRKITGDFDFQGQVRLASEGKNFALTEFVFYASGAALGALAGQVNWDNPGLHLRIMGGGWRAWAGRDALVALETKEADLPDAPQGPVWLRLTRRGDVWRTYRSTDGAAWVLTGVAEIAAPETLWAGWVFKRMANDGQAAPAVSTLSNVTLVNGPLNAMRADGWMAVDGRGDAAVTITDATSLTLTVADEAPTTDTEGPPVEQLAKAQWERRLAGDFDVVLQVEPDEWERREGETRAFGLSAATDDGDDIVYVAFKEQVQQDAVRLTYVTDMEINGGWYRWHESPTEDERPSYLRLTRVDGHVTASYWSDCQWQSFKPQQDDYSWPVFIRAELSTAPGGARSAAASATFTLAYVAEGPVVRDLPVWEPDGCGAPVGASTERAATPAPPTAAPALTDAQRLEANALFDDFSSAALGWSVREADSARTGYEDAAYAMLVKQPNFWVLSRIPGDFPHEVIEFDAAVAPGFTGGMYGVICHYADPQNFDFVAVDPETSSMSAARLQGNRFQYLTGTPGGVAAERVDSLAPAANAINHLRVGCYDDRLTLAIGGKTAGDWPLDPPGKAGSAALFLYGFQELGEAGYKVLFDNVAAQSQEAATSAVAPPGQPAATPTMQACRIAVAARIAPQWDRNALGCPIAPAQLTWAAVQAFERGLMLWRQDLQLIYTFPDGDRWERWPDLWAEGVRLTGRGQPPNGLQAPVRGFGFVWETEEAVFKNLGWARWEESGMCAVIQEFQRGLVIARSETDSCNGQASLGASGWFGSVDALSDGTWR